MLGDGLALRARSWAIADELRILASPRAGMRVAYARASGRSALARAATLCLLIGLACSASIERALLLPHVLSCALAWAFAPLIQAFGCAVLVWTANERAYAKLIDVHLACNGPYWLAAMLSTALALGRFESATTRYGPLAIATMAAILWGSWLSYLFARELLGLSRGRAVLAVAFEWLLRALSLLAWYAFMNNLVPQALGVRR